MKVKFQERAWEQYCHWQSVDKKTLKKINVLIKDIQRSPFSGIGMPEPLKHGFSGFWSRRIDEEHRLVYEIIADTVVIAGCRFHYDS